MKIDGDRRLMARRVEVPDGDKPFYSALQKVRSRKGACVQNIHHLRSTITVLFESRAVQDEIALGAPTPEIALIKVIIGYGEKLAGQEKRRYEAIFNLGSFGTQPNLNSLERRLAELGDEFGQSETRKNDADALTAAFANAMRTMTVSPNRAYPGDASEEQVDPRDGWERLVVTMLQSTEVDLVGIAPLPLLDVMRAEWPKAEQRPRLRYFTCPPETLSTTPLPKASVRPRFQLWHAAIMGLRNLLLNSDDAMAARFDRFAHTVDFDTAGCVILCRSGDAVSVWIANALPSRGMESARFVVSRPVAGLDQLVELVARFHENAARLILREVDCAADVDSSETADGFPAFRALGLSPFGTNAKRGEQVVQPVALTVLRADLPDGTHEVILKRRSPYTDISDFGIYSLLSARVQEIDLAKGLGLSVRADQDAEESYQRLWIAADCPRPFHVPREVFIAAAQRDVLTNTGMQIEPERFSFIGSHFTEITKGGLKLGFVAFLVDLHRTEQNDEVRKVISNGTGVLRRTRVAELDEGSLSVNRVLQARPPWLVDCLGLKRVGT